MSLDKKTINPAWTVVKIFAFGVFTGVLFGSVINEMTIDFDRECVIYTEENAKKGVIITTPEGVYEVLRVTESECKQPVKNGIFDNIVEHATIGLAFDIIVICVCLGFIAFYARDIVKYVLYK